MTDQLARSLAKNPKSGYIIAPAGFGKTYLIAESIKYCEGRQLILTHTFAGIDSIKTKLANQNVPSSQYHIDTIASFALKWVRAYPASTAWAINEPETAQDWESLYQKCTSLFTKSFVHKVFNSTYTGVFVDEYQDCSLVQHELVLKLLELKPTRLIGDPLQAIFDFGDGVVDWEKSIKPRFDKLGTLTVPWRWKLSGAEALGKWLFEIRDKIAEGKFPNAPRELQGFNHIHCDLDNAKDQKRLTEFRKQGKEKGSCIVVYPGSGEYKNKTHLLAKSLSGIFTSIEEVEGKALKSTVDKLVKAKSNSAKLVVVISFAKLCMTSVGALLPNATVDGRKAKVNVRTKLPLEVQSANSYVESGQIIHLMALLKGLAQHTETKVYRRDLFSRFLSVLSYAQTIPLDEAIKRYRQDFRHLGRPVRMSNQIGTTLLVKGLEYNHCIVAYPTKMSAKEFYVALTRGTQSVTVISQPDAQK
ncbi:UvrD-helicase domain-containing protein [Shewanella sp. SG41-3]|uniref:UvrD-helicase domain-containing protein n=1 Tax=Shewanella sp. SG41-3 TaxID=2760977 RepID=UPI001602F089|nr:UvrD-helicase domain-containing protein [Shewanella sp. SG41-3]MBB1476534.1 UvrD-helicase domain-containing protein [Shewanella sp. SG41-3]